MTALTLTLPALRDRSTCHRETKEGEEKQKCFIWEKIYSLLSMESLQSLQQKKIKQLLIKKQIQQTKMKLTKQTSNQTKNLQSGTSLVVQW